MTSVSVSLSPASSDVSLARTLNHVQDQTWQSVSSYKRPWNSSSPPLDDFESLSMILLSRSVANRAIWCKISMWVVVLQLKYNCQAAASEDAATRNKSTPCQLVSCGDKSTHTCASQSYICLWLFFPLKNQCKSDEFSVRSHQSVVSIKPRIALGGKLGDCTLHTRGSRPTLSHLFSPQLFPRRNHPLHSLDEVVSHAWVVS